MIGAGAGMFLFVGLWKPVMGTLAAVAQLWIACARPDDPWIPVILAVLGAGNDWARGLVY